MSGFGAVFATVIIFIVFTSAVTIIMEITTNSASLLSSEQPPTPLSNPAFGSGSISGPDSFLVNVTLGGSEQVRISDLKLSDLFVVYASNGSEVTERLAFGSDVSPCWQINGVFQGNIEGTLVDPINATQGTGIWIPGETLELNLTVSHNIDAKSEWYVSMTLADGGSCSEALG